MSSQASLKSKGRYDWSSSQASLKSRARSSQSSLRSKASKARYVVQAWVPQSAYLSPNLRNRLKNFALKPLTSVSSPLRRQELRQEIESSHNSINAADCLWNNNNFAFVAEAKAKTIQLRHRTLELLRKTDDSEALARSLWEEEQPSPEDIQDAYTHAEGGDDVEEDSFDALPGALLSSKITGSEFAAEGDEDVTTEERERRHNKIKSLRANMRRRLMSTSMLDDKIFKKEKRHTDTGERHSEARQDGPLLRRMRADRMVTQSALLDPDLSEFDEDIGGRRNTSNERSMRKDEGGRWSARHSPRPTHPGTVSLARGSGSRMSIASPRPPSVTLASRPGLTRSGSHASIANPATTRRSTFVGTSHLNTRRRSSVEKSTVLWEDAREISGTSKTCTLRLCGEQKAGGFSLEACLGKRGASLSSTVKRFLPTDEVEELFAWGQMQEKAPSEKYSWLFDLVSVTVEDDRIGPIGLGDWDVHQLEGKTSARMDDLGFTGDMKELFHMNRSRSKRMSREEEWSKQSTRLDDFEVRKAKDISMLAMKHNMDPSTAEALSQWYLRFDPEGIGKIDEEEFTTFIQKICHTAQRSFSSENAHHEIRWLLGELHTTRDHGGHLAFVQFADWLISKFPQITTMSAYEINRFSDFAEEANLTDSPRTTELQQQLGDLLKRKGDNECRSFKEKSERRTTREKIKRFDSTIKDQSDAGQKKGS
mmetsp:Transcript_104581/g.184594  ORF Transcript_104581/g.184594 Transcript_104581/m.184594 type:complete len:708 (+) Transcript_104581:133-2256(+)